MRAALRQSKKSEESRSSSKNAQDIQENRMEETVGEDEQVDAACCARSSYTLCTHLTSLKTYHLGYLSKRGTTKLGGGLSETLLTRSFLVAC